MALSLFDTQLLEKVLVEKFPEKQEFSKTEIIVILNEMTKAEKYYPRGKITKGQKYKIFKYFVRYCLYRNLANFDTMLLLTGDKGVGKSSFAIMISREWCKLLGIAFSSRHHMAYSNAQVQERIDNLPRFHPLICLSGKTKIIIRRKGVESYARISSLENKTDFEVLSYNYSNTQFEFVKPEKCVMTSACERVYTLELDNGTKIDATKYHKFLLKDGTYKTLNLLREGDEIVMYSVFCKQCGKEFSPKNQETKYCSISCRERHRRAGDKYKSFQNNYRQSNRKRLKEISKIYRKTNAEKIRQSKKEDREKNRERYKEKRKNYWEKNKDILSEKNKIWRKNNHSHLREYHNRIHKIKMITDPMYKIKRNLRRRTNLALKDQNVNSHASLTQYLGCSILDFKKYIKSKLLPGMTMKNYGAWHIDHIRPCASFNLMDLGEQKKCFHYTNLRPLWRDENLKKGYKYDNLQN